MLKRTSPYPSLALALFLFAAGCAGGPEKFIRDFDQRHYKNISRGIADVVDATDRALGEPRVEDREKIVRAAVGTSVTFRQNDDPGARLRLRLRLPLPSLERRVNVFFEIESEGDENLEDGETTASASVLARPDMPVSPGLRFGGEWDDGPVGFVRPFIRYEKKVDPLRYFAEQRLFLKTDGEIGGATLGQIDRLITEQSFVRFLLSAGYSDEVDGLDLLFGVQYRQPFVPESVISFETGLEFNTADLSSGDEEVDEGQGFIKVRWRGKVLRRWLEYEIRPAVFFPFEGDDRAELGILLGLSVIFEEYLRPRGEYPEDEGVEEEPGRNPPLRE